jgi:hypothetical protein
MSIYAPALDLGHGEEPCARRTRQGANQGPRDTTRQVVTSARAWPAAASSSAQWFESSIALCQPPRRNSQELSATDLLRDDLHKRTPLSRVPRMLGESTLVGVKKPSLLAAPSLTSRSKYRVGCLATAERLCTPFTDRENPCRGFRLRT